MIKFLVSFLLICVFKTADAQGKSIDKIVALVNDQMILESDLKFYRIKSRDSLNPNCEILHKLVINKLLYSKAVKDSLIVNDEEIDQEVSNRMDYFVGIFGGQSKFEKFYGKTITELKIDFREDTKQQMMGDRAKNKLLSGMTPSPRDVTEYYNKIPKDSLQYYNTEVQLAQIVFQPKISREAKRAAKLKAEKVRKEILSKESGFGTQAILYSDDPGSAANSGELGWIESGQMVPEFEQASFSLPIGQLSDLVETKYGIHLIEVMDRKMGKSKVRHILFSAKPDADGIQKAQLMADSIRKNINEGKISFQKAVELYSDDQFFKSNGGILVNMTSKMRSPVFEIGDIDPTLSSQITNMKPGDITTPQAYMTLDRKPAYRIVKLISETQPHRASLDKDYNKIKQQVHENLKDKALENWLKFYKNYVFVKLSDEYKSCESLKIFNSENQQ